MDKLPKITLVLGLIIFLIHGFSIIVNLITVVYPILRIQILLHDKPFIEVINKKRQMITPEQVKFFKDTIFWLKYWCVFALWIVLEPYILTIPLPLISWLLPYLKLSIFGYSIVRHHIAIDNTQFLMYDKLEEKLNQETTFDHQKLKELENVLYTRIQDVTFNIIKFLTRKN